MPAVTATEPVDSERLSELVNWLKYEPTPQRNKLDLLAIRLSRRFGRNRLVDWIAKDKGRERIGLAMETFRQLGPRAEPVIPQLTLVMKDRRPAISDRGIVTLGFVGKAAVPALLQARMDPAQSHKVHITRAIGLMGRGVTAALVECAHNEDVSFAISATIVLGELRFEPELVVPELMNGLTNHECRIRAASAQALHDFGQAGRPAIPRLLDALDDTDEYARRSAEFALQTIAPEELEKDRRTRT